MNAAALYKLRKGDFVADYFSVFQLGGALDDNGLSTNAWSVLETVYETVPNPQWVAIKVVSATPRRKRFALI